LPTIKDRSEILARWRAAKKKGVRRAEFANKLGMTAKALDCQLYRAKRQEQYHDRHQDIIKIDLGKPWRLTGDYCIVGDVHIPTTDYAFAELVAQVAKKMLKKPRLIVAGDMWNFDSLSYYDSIAPPPTAKQELEASRALVNEWLETFVSIDVIMGNHDRRWQKWALEVFDADDLAALVKGDPRKFRLSPYGWCSVTSGGIEWRIMHQKNYSINHLTLADAISAK